MRFKKLTALMLALLLMLSLAACGEEPAEPTGTPQTEPTQESTLAENNGETDGDDEQVYTPEVYPVEGLEEIAAENPILYFSLTVGETYDAIYTLSAYDNDDGSATIEYDVEEKKVGLVSSSVLHNLTRAFEESGLMAVNGRSEYTDAEGLASMYVCYADGTVVAADFSGVVPEECLTGFEAMEAHFRILTANIPLYVPTPQILGSVDAAALEEMLLILNGSGIEALDTLAISDIPMDAYFAFTAGLSGSDGIKNGTTCTAMMMTTPYSLVIVTLENADNAEAVCEDFKTSMNWRKWVCVAPSDALIAQKGNMVLCLMGSDDLYSSTANAVKAALWTEVEAMSNPDL